MSRFMHQFNGPLISLLEWSLWEELVETLLQRNDGQWYVYAVGRPAPKTPLEPREFRMFLTEMTQLLRNDHQESYLGIVYVDAAEGAEFVKIYDPNNLGSACGSSGQRVLPGWTVSRTPPDDLMVEQPLPRNRARWWQRLFVQPETSAERA